MGITELPDTRTYSPKCYWNVLERGKTLQKCSLAFNVSVLKRGKKTC